MTLAQPLPLAALPAHALALRERVRDFLRRQQGRWPLSTRVQSWMAFDADFSRELAAQGWVGVTLPPEYGGAGMDAFERFVLVEELLCHGAPVAAHWIADRQSGPLILRYGTPEQRARHLPAICRGESFFCIGMSEPGAGSDLASVRSRAVPQADGSWRLSGQKIWTTYAHHAHFMIALVRTSGQSSDRQAGLSQFIIDLHAPGVRIRPIEDLAGHAHFNEVFFDEVHLPADALVGTEGSGWQQVTAELAFERSGPERIYSCMALLDAWLQRARTRNPQAASLLAGRVMSHLAALRALSLATTARLVAGDSPVTEAALTKDLGTQLEQDIPTWLADALASDPLHPDDTEWMRALAVVVQIAPTYALRGGTREILRGMIARGLGLR